MTEGIAAAQVTTREVDLAAGWTIGGFLCTKKDIDFSGFFLLALSNSCSSLVNFYLLLKGKKSHNLCCKESEYTQLTFPAFSLSLIPHTRSTFFLRRSWCPFWEMWSFHLDMVQARPDLTLTLVLQRLQLYHIPSIMSTDSQ